MEGENLIRGKNYPKGKKWVDAVEKGRRGVEPRRERGVKKQWRVRVWWIISYSCM